MIPGLLPVSGVVDGADGVQTGRLTRVRTWCSSFGWAVMNACEPQRAERGDVVGDYREHRLGLTGGLVDRRKIGKWVAEHLLVGGQRQLDGIDGVVLIRVGET